MYLIMVYLMRLDKLGSRKIGLIAGTSKWFYELNIHRNKKNRKGEEVSKLKGKSYIASEIHNYVWGDEKKGEVEYETVEN